MKFFLDTEFMEDGRTIDLLSVGIVTENGQEFYRQSCDADQRKANQFVTYNVIPKLWPCPRNIPGPRHKYGSCGDTTCVWSPRRHIALELAEWIGLLSKPDGFQWVKPEFWGYYADYDWVVLCQLFGTMTDLPSGWPMYCRDLKQYVDSLGNFDLPPEGKDEHNSLSDARWLRGAYNYVVEVEADARRKKSGAIHQESKGLRGPEEEVRRLAGWENEGGAHVERTGSEEEEVTNAGTD